MFGKHTMKHWSSTQSSTALSSGEAEFAGVIRGSGQGLGYQALLEDLGIKVPLRVWTDSSAAIGICSRQGLGKMRHLDTHTLWIQQAVRSKRVDLRKVLGEENPADLLTKHSSSRAKLEYLVSLFGCRYCDGRPSSAPLLRRGESTKVTMAQAAGDLGVIAGGNAKNQYTKTYRDLRPVPPGDDALAIARQNATISRGTARQNATAPEELTRESEDPGAAPAMEETYPILPHLEFSEEELEIRQPSLKAPAEERLEDVLRDGDDVVYNHGLAIAQEIQEEVAELGRRRHAVPDKERLDAVSAQEVTEKEIEKEMNIPSDAVFTAGREKIPSDAVFTAGRQKNEKAGREKIPSDAVFTAGREKNEKEMDIPSDAVFTAGACRRTTLPEAYGAAHRQTALPALGGGPGLPRGPPRDQLHPPPVAFTATRTSRVRPRARRSAAGGVREWPPR